jgi:hypothetical protein
LLAEVCGVTSNDLHADDAPSELEKLVGATNAKRFWFAMPLNVPESIDSFEFFVALERQVGSYLHRDLKLDIDTDFQKEVVGWWKSERTFGSWIFRVARKLSSRIDGAGGGNG